MLLNIAVIGCGALGLLWGARLSALNQDVVLFTRTPEQKNILHAQGIRYRDPWNKFSHCPVIVEMSDFMIPRRFDMVLVMVKQVHLAGLMRWIQSITHSESQILFFQNGLGHDEHIRHHLEGRPWTYAVVTTEGALRKGPREVHHTGIGTTWMGRFPEHDGIFHPQIEQWVQCVQAMADVNMYKDEAIEFKMWEKLLINCVINPLTALEDIQNGDLLDACFSEKIRQLIKEEIVVADKMGFHFHEQDIFDKVFDVCAKTQDNISSMAQDVRRGVYTEIDYLNGMIVRYGEREGVATPYHRELVDRIEQKSRNISREIRSGRM